MSQVDAEQYYSELEEQLTDEFNAELNRVQLKRLDLIFVTFQDARTVKRWVLNDQSSNSECSSAYGGRVDATFLPSSSLREKGDQASLQLLCPILAALSSFLGASTLLFPT